MPKMISPAEKEKRVIELHEQGMSFRDIASKMKMSFTTISPIIKKHTAEQEENKKRQEEKLGLSKSTQAFKLFEQGNRPIEVAIKLNLPEEEVTKLFRDYWKLMGLYDLNELYEEMEGEIFQLVQLYIHIKKAGMGPQQVIRALKVVEQLPSIEKRFQTCRNDLDMLESRKEKVTKDLHEENNKIANYRAISVSYNESITISKKELENLVRKIQRLENYLDSLKNNQDYYRVARISREHASQVLNDKRLIVNVVILSVLAALKEHPEKQLLIYDSLDPPEHKITMIPFGVDSRVYRQFCLKDLQEDVYDKLSNRIVGWAISSASFSES